MRLRGAEIAFSIARTYHERHKMSGFAIDKFFDQLVAARRNHAIFQHHDGITGTAKDHVVIDYGQRFYFETRSQHYQPTSFLSVLFLDYLRPSEAA